MPISGRWRSGVTADDVIGRVIWERFPQLVGTLNEQVLRRVRAGTAGPSPSRRRRRRQASGSRSTSGRLGDGVTVYWRDISERIEAEQALRSFAGKLEREVADRTRALSEAVEELRRSRERYSAIFENSPVDLVFMAVEPDGRIVCEDANPAWERHSG